MTSIRDYKKKKIPKIYDKKKSISYYNNGGNLEVWMIFYYISFCSLINGVSGKKGNIQILETLISKDLRSRPLY